MIDNPYWSRSENELNFRTRNVCAINFSSAKKDRVPFEIDDVIKIGARYMHVLNEILIVDMIEQGTAWCLWAVYLSSPRIYLN